MEYLKNWLENIKSSESYLFTSHDLRALFPDLSDMAFKTLLSRSVRAGYLNRLCRGLYVHKQSIPPHGLLLFHVASLLRSSEFNYISLETILSDAGIISQIPMNWISIMSSGRSNIISCGDMGTIEFIHTKQKPEDIMDELSYDSNCRLWRASVRLALRDMKVTHRNCDLINLDVDDEFVR